MPRHTATRDASVATAVGDPKLSICRENDGVRVRWARRVAAGGELLLRKVVVELVRTILIGAERADRREDERRVEGLEERLGPFQRSVA